MRNPVQCQAIVLPSHAHFFKLWRFLPVARIIVQTFVWLNILHKKWIVAKYKSAIIIITMFSNKSYIVSTGVYEATDVQKNNDVPYWSHTWKRFGKSSFLGVTPSFSHKFLGVLTTSVGGVGDDVLRGLLGWRTCVGGVLACVGWLGWVAFLHGLRASKGGVGNVLAWKACHYYCYCCYWNTILNKKMLNVYFWNKNKIMFQID